MGPWSSRRRPASPEPKVAAAVPRRYLPRLQEGSLVAAEPLLSQQPRKFWIMSLAMLDKQAQQSSQIGCLKCGPRGPGRGAERCRDLHCQARGGGEGTVKDIRLALCGGPQSCPAVGAPVWGYCRGGPGMTIRASLCCHCLQVVPWAQLGHSPLRGHQSDLAKCVHKQGSKYE